MSTFALARLLERARAGVFVLAADVTRSRLSELCKAHNLYFLVSDCRDVGTKDSLLQTLARDLRFPAHFGVNWDALADCLMDMERVKATGAVILLLGLEDFARAQPAEYETFRNILQDAALYWAEEPAPFYVLLAGDADALGPELARVTAS